MLRTIAISLILLLSVGIMLPFANSAHGIRQSTQIAQKKSKRYRSRAWWKRYRARMRQKRLAAEMAKRKEMLTLPQNIAMGNLSNVSGPALPALPSSNTGNAALSFQELPPAAMTPAPVTLSTTNVTATAVTSRNTVATAPLPAPVQVNPVAADPAPVALSAHATATATRPRVVNAVRPVLAPGSGATKQLPGQMNLSVVALSRPNPLFLTSREQKKMLAGVPVSDLRRIVIDKMVSSGGWVVNDFVREVNGNRVFVVTARTPKDALTPEKAWTFYFTEAGGRVYGLTTEAPVEYADRMSNEAERFIETLRAKPEGTKE
ncbi:MAG TPA: hypothetical protein VFS76_22745 [Pyrinomonadaceae bacterium]|nr:hypothetical protein [Pyrinomonadaceae bacterium]